VKVGLEILVLRQAQDEDFSGVAWFSANLSFDLLLSLSKDEVVARR